MGTDKKQKGFLCILGFEASGVMVKTQWVLVSLISVPIRAICGKQLFIYWLSAMRVDDCVL